MMQARFGWKVRIPTMQNTTKYSFPFVYYYLMFELTSFYLDIPLFPTFINILSCPIAFPAVRTEPLITSSGSKYCRVIPQTRSNPKKEPKETIFFSHFNWIAITAPTISRKISTITAVCHDLFKFAKIRTKLRNT